MAEPLRTKAIVAAGVFLGGLCFSQLAPLAAGLLLLPEPSDLSLSPVNAGLAAYINQIELAGNVMHGLRVIGMAVAGCGILYAIAALAFESNPDSTAPSGT